MLTIISENQRHEKSFRLEPKSKAEIDLEDFDIVFKALSHPSRRHILVVLQTRGGRMTAGDIQKRFVYRWPTITRHLRRLEEAGLVSVSVEGREHFYTLGADRLKDVVARWLDWFQNQGRADKDP
jgi:DNA-binding transcriptional ArsR family regulator